MNLSVDTYNFFKLNELTFSSTITVLWDAWDCDSVWYLCKNKDNKYVLVATNHGGHYIANVSALEERLSVYQDVVKETQYAIQMLRGNNEHSC